MSLQSPIDPHSEGRRKTFIFALLGLIALGLLLFMLAKSLHAQTPPAANRNISASWSFDYGPMPACSAHLGVNCVNGFQVGTWNGSACSDILRIANPPNPTGVVKGIHVNWKSSIPTSAVFCVAATWFNYASQFQVGAPSIEGGGTKAAGQVSDFMVLRR